MQRPGYLVETNTIDRVRLHGFWQPLEEANTDTRPPLWIVVHGVSGNFYDSKLLKIVSDSILESGRDVLRVNTRGHDAIAYIHQGDRTNRVGAAYESMSDARCDLESWLQWASDHGYAKVGLLGHSLGAVKVVLTAIHHSDELIGVVCVSPPRLNRAVLMTDPTFGSVFEEHCREANDAVTASRPELIMKVRYPQPMLISAATYLDKYGSDRHDYRLHASKICCPCLWTFGQEEVDRPHVSFFRANVELEAELAGHSNHRIVTIDQADHQYSLARTLLASTVVKWMDED